MVAALRVQHPEKRKAHCLEPVGFSAKRTISGNGRCVGLNFGTSTNRCKAFGVDNPDIPPHSHSAPPSVLRQRAAVMDDFLTAPAFPTRTRWAIACDEWDFVGQHAPRASRQHGPTSGSRCREAANHAQSTGGMGRAKPRRSRRQAMAKDANVLNGM